MSKHTDNNVWVMVRIGAAIVCGLVLTLFHRGLWDNSIQYILHLTKIKDSCLFSRDAIT